MPISVSGSDAVFAAIDNQLEAMRLAILERLARVGEKAVALQRKSHIYTDQTGNLTSSIGFVVFDRGRVYRNSSFRSVRGKEGVGRDGAAAGKQMVSDIASACAGLDMALVIVAGMEYAFYVEQKGLNVLDTAILYSRDNASKNVTKAIETTIKIINEMFK